ncbi:DivIVA domain-containing protein [Rhodococcus erythropolis]|uniref:DivIVA domain-containing protein n=1 Tax=Rhodococcus erythropolis TaxID=1833 RepID=UPI00294A662C|nr:DivIVA domain-containing protein [Rhodococcus erythropolis]MDV6276139.1 DivIVA domain-containing protein [Rhodococcus erythropolis]
MMTILLYLIVMALVGAMIFLAASAVFGRSEELPPLPPGTTATVLPAADVTGADVDALRFQQVLRGYKVSEVDWALHRLGLEIDSLRAQMGRDEKSEVLVHPESLPKSEASSAAPESSSATDPESKDSHS